MRSMTGFGSAQLERDGCLVRVEVRTVNHRHLQVRTKLPSGWQHLEGELETLVKGRLERGAVQLAVHMEAARGRHQVVLDEHLAGEYKRRLQQLAEGLGIAGDVSLERLIALPGVLVLEENQGDSERETRLVHEVLGAALEDLVGMRTREGQALSEELLRLADRIDTDRASIEARRPEAVRAMQEKLRERVQNLLGGQEPVPEKDLAREIALLADRLDVQEELARLAAHLGQLRELVQQGGAVGRKLDFLAQEFMREANTIGSKCADAATAHLVVDLKTGIEQLREQVQNVE
ncbi:MAG: YicC/YloC family endoribonuclease [Planctomycetota bacterium]